MNLLKTELSIDLDPEHAPRFCYMIIFFFQNISFDQNFVCYNQTLTRNNASACTFMRSVHDVRIFSNWALLSSNLFPHSMEESKVNNSIFFLILRKTTHDGGTSLMVEKGQFWCQIWNFHKKQEEKSRWIFFGSDLELQ